jgi:TusA-related sulfurtransferase
MSADRRIDCSGQLCPVPILMAEEKIKEMKKGEVLEVLYTDPGAKPDLLAWCKATGNRALGFKEGKQKSFAYVQKG